MRIAVDLDGVVFNSDMYFMAMGEIFDCGILKRNSLICPSEARVQEKYDWSSQEIEEYVQRYACTRDFEFMPCAKEVIECLMKSGHTIYFISARGQFSDEEIVIAKEKLDAVNLSPDKWFWNCVDKEKICIKEKIDIIIDDSYAINEALKDTNIICIYYRMAGKKKLARRQNLHEVHNWGEIYRVLHELNLFEKTGGVF